MEDILKAIKKNIFEYLMLIGMILAFLYIVFFKESQSTCFDYSLKYKIIVNKSFMQHGVTSYRECILYKNNEKPKIINDVFGISYCRELGNKKLLLTKVATPYVLYKKAYNDTLILRKSINQYDSIEYKFLIERFCED